MRRALRVIFLALLPYLVVLIAIVAWFALAPNPRHVAQPVLAGVSAIDVSYRGEAVRRLTEPQEIAAVLQFLNSRRNGWSESPDGLTSQATLQVVLSRPSASPHVVEVRSYLWSLQRDGKIFTRLFSSHELIELTSTLGFPRPSEEALRHVQDQPFDRFIELVTNTSKKPN